MTNLIAIFTYVNKIVDELEKLKNFHDNLFMQTVPQQYPCNELHKIISGWAPYVFEGIHTFIYQLEDRALDIRGELVFDPHLNLSLFPANIPRFILLEKELEVQVP